MDLVDLYPQPIITGFGDIIFRLSHFDLRAIVWAESFFSESDRGGLNAMYYILNNPPENENDVKKWRVFSCTVADVAFYLADGLEIKTPEDFKRKINESNPSQSIARLSKSISDVLSRSFPNEKKSSLTGGEIFKKAVQSEEQKPPDWAKIYADFYRFGGMTLDQFYSLTIRQINAIYKRIDESRIREIVDQRQFECSIRGINKEKWPRMPQRTEETEEIDHDEIKRRQEQHNKIFGDPEKWREM